MAKILTLEDTRKMSKSKINTEVGKIAKELDSLGLDHETSCAIISSIMNLGIAAHELCHRVKNEKK